MITKSNFRDLLKTLGFSEESDTFRKSIGAAELKVDCTKEKIIYPEDSGLIVNRQDTCNFSSNENFVVFECVYRLLEKGYKPEHLELEPTWRIGHSASGGRADILVKDQENNPLLIIECKTPGNEFDKAWQKTEQDGGQLFSYAQQIPKTQYLCLYASDFVENSIRIEQRIIPHHDNEKILAQDETSHSFAEAANVEDRYTIWRKNYQLEYTESGIFEDNVSAYQIGKNKYTVAEDTNPIDAVDKEGKYHTFRTILRKHNIARRENAFEVLVNLFLCKLVDEEENKEDLQFYWKGRTYDNYFDFVDRLQNLYQKGMHKYLKEEISYISNEQIDNAFWTVKNKRNATKEQIQRYFRELKFFSNSAFSFIDTHNEALFKKNTKVLAEVVQMWQKLRLKTDDNQNQFLGDMFEFFLDDGIKQSEGQFFTPLPICKFIVSSLPLSEKIAANPEPLKVIDYACGSGHFLNEYAHQIRPLVLEQNREVRDYYKHIIGIEKEDRLAKVAKVAAYMHGQGEINILDADALAPHSEVPAESFDILVANPPFAVEGFLQTLSESDKTEYQLTQVIKKNSNTNTIQCFFLERIHHFMAPDGVVGVIVPSSILSTSNSAVHTRTREILLQFFDIVSIAELGSKTFSKTGTSTVVLFLRRKAQKPEPAEHYRNRVVDFFEGDKENAEYQDHYLIRAYCEHIKVPYEEYIKLFTPTCLEQVTPLLQHSIFNDYKETFSNGADIKDLKKNKAFQKQTAEEQTRELEQRLIDYLQKIEMDKLYYFILAHEQPCEVVVVNAPDSATELKQFLGYGWSGTKGKEGIKYNGGTTVNDIITPLFDPDDLDNRNKINTAIKHNFMGETMGPLPDYCHFFKLVDLLNFSRVDFDKSINLNPQNTNIETQWLSVKLGDEVETIETGRRPKGGVGNITSGAWSLGGEHIHPTSGRIDLTTPSYVPLDFFSDSTKGILQENDILLCKDGALSGKIALLREELKDQKAMINEHVYLLRCAPLVKQYYIFYFLFSENGQNLLKQNITGSAQGGINSTNLKNIQIPIPSPETQKKIVDECEIVNQNTNQMLQTIIEAQQHIEAKVQSIINGAYQTKNVDKVLTLEYGFSLTEGERINGDFPVYGANGIIGSHNEFQVKAPCIIIGRKGSAGEINWSDKNCTPIDTAFYVKLLDETTTNLKFIYHILRWLNLPSLRTGSGPGGINRNQVYNLSIPIPPFDIQQQLAAKVEELELEISEAQATIDNAIEAKNAILSKYL